MRDAVRNKERWKRRRVHTQDPSTVSLQPVLRACQCACQWAWSRQGRKRAAEQPNQIALGGVITVVGFKQIVLKGCYR